MFPYANSFYMATEHEILQYDAPYHGPQQTFFYNLAKGDDYLTVTRAMKLKPMKIQWNFSW